MIHECKFTEGADIIPVQRGLSVHVPDALDYGRIKDTSVPSQYNGQKSIAEVGQRVAEPFDVIEFDRTYTRIRKRINDSEYVKNKDKDK